MYAALGINEAQVCTVWQVHSNDVLIAQQPVRGRRWLAHADAMITDRPGLSLSMRFADCAPLLFFDPVGGAIGLAHAGWRGTVAGIGACTIRALKAVYGCKPQNIQVVIGPSIGPKHYQVGPEVVEAVREHFGTTKDLIHLDSNDNTTYFDLWEANALDMRKLGVEDIEIAGISTADHTHDFFSHRAERGVTGRFGVVMCL
jgi:hypothetical protein